MASKRPPLKYRKFRKIMESFGLREVKKQGKGSHRMFIQDPNGKRCSFPLACHNENVELNKNVVNAARRTFSLTPDNGVTDEEFYGRA
jgi:predicted RNA binding protein YcfA (HicA-like mRNA interferase family)